MTFNFAKKILVPLFKKAGISIGSSKNNDIIVHDESFFTDILFKASLGTGDSYIEGKWDCDKMDEVAYKILKHQIYNSKVAYVYDFMRRIKRKIVNMQCKKGAKEVIEKHYNLPANFFQIILDPYMQYTCAYWNNAKTLNQAQKDKLELICKKLIFTSGENLLDIGGGWGGLSEFASKNYGAKVDLVTLSKEQAKYAKEKCKNLPVKIHLFDYRDIPTKLNGKKFNKISSVGMLEHIGHKNHRKFMEIVHQSLKPKGLFLLQTIYTPHSKVACNPWLDKHIFPNHEIPTKDIVKKVSTPYFNKIQFEEITPSVCWKNPLLLELYNLGHSEKSIINLSKCGEDAGYKLVKKCGCGKVLVSINHRCNNRTCFDCSEVRKKRIREQYLPSLKSLKRTSLHDFYLVTISPGNFEDFNEGSEKIRKDFHKWLRRDYIKKRVKWGIWVIETIETWPGKLQYDKNGNFLYFHTKFGFNIHIHLLYYGRRLDNRIRGKCNNCKQSLIKYDKLKKKHYCANTNCNSLNVVPKKNSRIVREWMGSSGEAVHMFIPSQDKSSYRNFPLEKSLNYMLKYVSTNKDDFENDKSLALYIFSIHKRKLINKFGKFEDYPLGLTPQLAATTLRI